MTPDTFLENFTTHLKNTLARSISIAASLEHQDVGPVHMLFALSEESGSVGAEILFRLKIDSKIILKFVESLSTELVTNRSRAVVKTSVLPNLDADSKQILERAMLLAYQRGHTFIGTEHLLFSILEQNHTTVKSILDAQSIDISQLQNEIETVLESTSKFPDIEDVNDALEQLQEMTGNEAIPASLPISTPTKKSKSKKHCHALEQFAVNLTDTAHTQQIDPLIGRNTETERLIHILARRTKNNPILIGEAGVGKTAIVEGLAKSIIDGNVPDILKRTQIFSLDLALMISGTIYRGEFESRLKQVIDEVSASKNVILFVDEVHNIMGAGSNSGTMDAANILKPALARGKLHCIGATTIDEYKKHISADPALERRFQPIYVSEPTVEQTTQILNGIKKEYENFHNTSIAEDAVAAAVELSSRFIHDTYMPDKAIDLLDEASAAVHSSIKNTPIDKKVIELEQKLEACLEEKEKAIQNEKFDLALKLKKEEAKLRRQWEKMVYECDKQKKPPRKRVTKKDVVHVISRRYDIPKDYLMANEWERLRDLSGKLQRHIVGQDMAINQICQSLEHAHLRLHDGNKPFSTSLFVGPSGVGKTALAKALARELYQDETALIKLDMSEFSESHGVSKILGSPAGYVGHKDRNRFTDELRRRPYTVVLFDEFDKAHPDVQKLLLQILDEGEITDSQGQKISFRHSVIILTSNVGAEVYKSAGIGFGNSNIDNNDKILQDAIQEKLKDSIGSALLSRIQTVIPFTPLDTSHVEKIVRKKIEQMSKALTNQNKFSIKPDDAVIKDLAKKSHSTDMGVRNLDTVVQKALHDALLKTMQKKNIKKTYKLAKQANKFTLV